MEHCVRQSDKRRSVINIFRAVPPNLTKFILQVTFDAELLMMPKDKDVQVILLE